MPFFAYADTSLIATHRRRLLHGAMLSGAAVALLAGRDALAARVARPEKSASADASILNTALAAELEAVAAYQVAADSGLLDEAVLGLAKQFQGHHRAHVDLLAKTVAKLGGRPVAARRSDRIPARGIAMGAVLRSTLMSAGFRAGNALLRAA